MALPGSGEISLKDIANEKENLALDQAKENISLEGLSRDGNSFPDYNAPGGSGTDIAINADSVNSALHGGPDGLAEHKASEFYGYDQDFVATSFNGTGAGTVSSFSTNTSTSVNVASAFTSGSSRCNLDTSSFRLASFWEMNNFHARGNSPSVQSNSTATIHVGNDKTNKRIMILLLKDGDADALAGGGNNSGYILIPYVNLENATWTYTYEYNTATNGYNLSEDKIGSYRGNPTGQGTFTTSGTYITKPSNTNEGGGAVYASIPGFTGMAANGESLITDGSSSQKTWAAKVPSSENNISVGLGTTSFFSNLVQVRIRIKAVDGSDTYTALSNYWSLSQRAQRGFGF